MVLDGFVDWNTEPAFLVVTVYDLHVFGELRFLSSNVLLLIIQ